MRHDGSVAKRRSRRGEGSVFWSKSERAWIARVSLGVVNGRRVRRKARADSEAEAKQKLDELLRDYTASDPDQERAASLDEYLDAWFRRHSRTIRPSTRVGYRLHIDKHISPLLGGIRVSRLRTADVRRLVDELERKGLAAGTVHLVIRTLSVALNSAVADGILDRSPLLGVELPRIDREPVRPLAASDADAVLDAVAGTWVELPVRVWLGSGMRRGEVVGLDQRDLGLDAGFVRVRVTKTRVRAVPVSDDAVAALRQALVIAPRRGPDEPVFFAPKSGDRIKGDSLSHALPRILEQAGLARLTPHALRHGAATLMLAEGVQMRVIAEQLGHRNPALTSRIYAHVVPEQQRAAVAHLERRRNRSGPD